MGVQHTPLQGSGQPELAMGTRIPQHYRQQDQRGTGYRYAGQLEAFTEGDGRRYKEQPER